MIRTFLAVFLILLSGCSPYSQNKNKEVLAKIDNYCLYTEDFIDEVKSIPDFRRAGKTSEELLDELIQKKLLLLEAQREGLDKQGSFMKMVEHFWEQSLLRSIVEKKMKEFAANEDIRNNIEQEKVRKKFEEWQGSMRNKAKIYINKKALEKVTIPTGE